MLANDGKHVSSCFNIGNLDISDRHMWEVPKCVTFWILLTFVCEVPIRVLCKRPKQPYVRSYQKIRREAPFALSDILDRILSCAVSLMRLQHRTQHQWKTHFSFLQLGLVWPRVDSGAVKIGQNYGPPHLGWQPSMTEICQSTVVRSLWPLWMKVGRCVSTLTTCLKWQEEPRMRSATNYSATP